MPEVWRRCSSCRKDIVLGARYWACSVSTCNRPRSALYFCSMECWDAHLPVARHREAWAEEKVAPTTADGDPAGEDDKPRPRTGRRRVAPATRRDPSLPRETLVVVSKVKAYVKAASGFNTSDAVMDVLSEKLRDICDRAIAKAREDGRKTILDRDLGY